MRYSKKYVENQFLKTLNDAYHRREQLGTLTATVTTLFANDASSLGAKKLMDKLVLKADVDHDAAVDALVELLS